MRKLFLILLILISTTSLFAQSATLDTMNKSYPQFMISNNDTFVVFTLQQAQKIDNDYELLELLERSKTSCDSTITYYISVINEYGKTVALLETKIQSLEKINSDQKYKIGNLKQQISNYKIDLMKANQQIDLQSKIISNQEKRVKSLKLQKTLGWIGTGVFFIATSILLNMDS